MPRKPPALAALDVASPPAHSAAAEAYAAAGRDNADALIGKESFATSDGSVRVDQQGMVLGDSEHIQGAVSWENLEVLAKLGAGCSSTVHLARDRRTGQLFALKLIGLYDKRVRDMLLTELQALFRSDCEALIDFYGVTYREGQVAVVLEFCNLGGLDNVLRHAPGRCVPEAALAGIAFQCLWGLGYLAHERRVHRDVKPANILVCTTGRVKLTDFGISKALETAVLARTFVGSFKYMSPERILHQPYDYSSDIWSLGLVLLEAAQGSYPYPEAESQVGMVMTLTGEKPPAPPKDGRFTPAFAAFIEACLQRDPSNRASAVDLLEHPWLAEQGIGSVEEAIEVVRVWLGQAGFKDQTAGLAVANPLPGDAAPSSGGSASIVTSTATRATPLSHHSRSPAAPPPSAASGSGAGSSSGGFGRRPSIASTASSPAPDSTAFVSPSQGSATGLIPGMARPSPDSMPGVGPSGYGQASDMELN